MTVNEEVISNLSEVGVSIVNLGRTDHADIPIFIDLHLPVGTAGKLEIVSSTLLDHNGSTKQFRKSQTLLRLTKAATDLVIE